MEFFFSLAFFCLDELSPVEFAVFLTASTLAVDVPFSQFFAARSYIPLSRSCSFKKW